jgi:hypothetical protein
MNTSVSLLTKPAELIHQGMPEFISDKTKSTSFFEFWPLQIIYIPVVFQWFWLALKYRSFSLPLVANPSIHLSGMVGESKSAVLKLAGTQAQTYIAPFISIENRYSLTPELRTQNALEQLNNARINFPLIAKPDLGCRGAGVQIIRNKTDLTNYFKSFPDNASLLLQHKVPHEAEAGIFYIRQPGDSRGEIFSITLKYMPYVIGDGKSSLRELINNDNRAKKIAAIYFKRHTDSLNCIIPQGKAFRLAFAGSHSKGSIFRNGNHYITESLREKFDDITADIPDFYYGRFDIRFENIDKLMQGKSFSILEINGASSEATHIWDRQTSIKEVYKTLFYQYRTLFKIGYKNHQLGHKTPSLLQLLQAWKLESRLVKQYPETD